MTIRNHSRICLMISGAILAIALVMSLVGAGLNLGVDFAGGLNLRYDMKQAFQLEDIEAALKAQGTGGYRIARSGEGGEILEIRTRQLSDEAEIQKLQSGLTAALLEKYPGMDTETATASAVGPTAGAALVPGAIISVLVASALILIYMAIRFDFSSGLAAVAGLLHDVVLMVSIMVLLRGLVQINSSFIAALLAVAGYSITNSIMIFDRIRQHNRKPPFAGASREEMVNISVKECLNRTISLTLTALIILVALCILGADSIRQLSLPIIIGILISVYSANMMSGYWWALLQDRRSQRKKQAKKKNVRAKKA